MGNYRLKQKRDNCDYCANCYTEDEVDSYCRISGKKVINGYEPTKEWKSNCKEFKDV